MAKVMFVKMSDLGGRWDPEFYLAVQPLKTRVEELKTLHPDKDRVMAILSALPQDLSKEYAILSRRQGSVRSGVQWTADARLSVEREYPWIALAMAETGLESAKQAISLRIAAQQDSLAAIEAIAQALQKPSGHPALAIAPATPGAHLGLVAGFRYPLKTPDYYDDEWGSGYQFADVPGDVAGGPYRVADAWITNEHGEVHPGYSSNPVAILADDVDLDKPEPSLAGARERASPFSSFGN